MRVARTPAASRLHAPGASISVPPAGISTPPSSVRTRAIRNCVRSGLSRRSVSSMKLGMRLAVVAQRLLQVGALAEHPQRERQQPHGRLLAAGEQVGGEQRGVAHLRRRPVGERRRGQAGEDVVARLAATVLDVLAELLVEELERLVLHVLVHGRQPVAEQLVVGLGHALEVGDDGQRERLGVLRRRPRTCPSSTNRSISSVGVVAT